MAITQDKPISDKRQHFVREYCNNGHNASEAYKTAFPKCKGGWNGHGARLVAIGSIKMAIAAETALIETEDEDSRKYIDNQFKSLLKSCIVKGDKVNAARCLENMAKHRGYYAEDNLQRTEQAKLTEQQVKEAKEYAKWRLLRGLSEEVEEGTSQAVG